MRLVLSLLVALALAGAARAGAYRTVALPAAENVSLPYLCDWGYDWEERCYRDDFDRLELGGAADKVWRSALRFSLEGLPPSATVLTAELVLDRPADSFSRLRCSLGSTRPRSFSLDVS